MSEKKPEEISVSQNKQKDKNTSRPPETSNTQEGPLTMPTSQMESSASEYDEISNTTDGVRNKKGFKGNYRLIEKHIATSTTQHLAPATIPVKADIPKFNKEHAQKTEILELLNRYIKLKKRRSRGDSEEAQKYWNCATERIQELEVQNVNLKQQLAKSTEEKGTDEDSEQIDQNKAITHTENIEKLEEKIKEKDCQIKILEERLKRQEQNQQQKETQNTEQTLGTSSQTLDKTILNIINERVQNIEKYTEEIREKLNITKNTEEEKQDTQAQQQYSEVLKKQESTPRHNLSRAAILIKRNTSTNTTLSTIREILNRAARNTTGLPKITCYTSRDKNTLIIQAEDDTKTEEVLKFIETIATLKDITELTFRSTNMKKVIIIGIPNIMESEEITEKILTEYKVEVPVEILRKIQRKGAKTYQLVINIEANMARILTQDGRILIGFNSCRIEEYRPVIRCGHCQRYGHTSARCRYEQACAYCKGIHETENCKYRETPNKHKCINCAGTREDFPHAANSSKCPVFLFYLKDRNNSIKNSSQNSKY